MKKLLTLAMFTVCMTGMAQNIGREVAAVAAKEATKATVKGVAKEITTPKEPTKLVINEATKTIDLDATELATTQKPTGYTATYKGVSYPVYESSKGKLFIYMTSKKSGKEYKKYLN